VVLVAAAGNSSEKMFAVADQNMYWNSRDSLYREINVLRD
jgi:hypothetical protein